MTNQPSKLSVCLKIIAITFLFSLALMPLRSGSVNILGLEGFVLSSIIGSVVYFLLFIYFKRKVNYIPTLYLVISMIIGISIINLPIRILTYKTSIISVLEYVIHILSVLLLPIGFRFTRYYKYVYITFVFGFLFLLSTRGYELWLNKVNYGNYILRADKNIPISGDWTLLGGDGSIFKLNNIKEECTIIDFWITNCGYCYQSFPKIEKMFNDYQINHQLNIISVHCFNEKEDYKTGQSIIQKLNYTFPVFSTNIQSDLLKQLDIKKFPCVCIIKNKKIIFIGNDLESTKKIAHKLIRKKN